MIPPADAELLALLASDLGEAAIDTTDVAREVETVAGDVTVAGDATEGETENGFPVTVPAAL